MTFEEFERAQPKLAASLRRHAWNDVTIDGVYDNDGRWEAYCTVGPAGEFDIMLEGRCHDSCIRWFDGRKREWVWQDHVCCRFCMKDPDHRYETLHE